MEPTPNPIRDIEGRAVALPIANLDTDQIMPKQFLRGIDKAGLDRGLLYDLRFDAEGHARPDCVLNRPDAAGAPILVGGPNFGCGSSREHAVWGLMQYGFQAVVAPSFGEIFYSNALNNRLLVVQVDEAAGAALLAYTSRAGATLRIDVAERRVHAGDTSFVFTLAPRHQAIFLQGLDMIGATLADRAAIDAFAQRRAQSHPWLHDVGRRVRARLDAATEPVPPGLGDAQPAPRGGQGNLGRPGVSLGANHV